MPRSIDAPTPIAASDTDTDKHSNAWYDHDETETVSHTCVSSGSDGSHDKLGKAPLSRGRAIALVITLTGAAFINVRRAFMIAPRLENRLIKKKKWRNKLASFLACSRIALLTLRGKKNLSDVMHHL